MRFGNRCICIDVALVACVFALATGAPACIDKPEYPCTLSFRRPEALGGDKPDSILVFDVNGDNTNELILVSKKNVVVISIDRDLLFEDIPIPNSTK